MGAKILYNFHITKYYFSFNVFSTILKYKIRCIADEMCKSKPASGLDLASGWKLANSCPAEMYGQI